ncbi:hypothetical protein ACWGH4_14120 [Streptomyces sp. NPDC054847]
MDIAGVLRHERGRRGHRAAEAWQARRTGFATRAVSGKPPAMPPPGRLDAAVHTVIEAMAGEAHMVSAKADGTHVLGKEGA